MTGLVDTATLKQVLVLSIFLAGAETRLVAAGSTRYAQMSAASPTIHAMLIATWILAMATLVLALSVPIAWFTWLSARRQDRERRQRERETEAREQLLRDVKEKYVTRDGVTGAAVLGGVLAVLGGLAWLDRKRS